MTDIPPTCIMFINYEGLLIGLSQQHQLNIDGLLDEMLAAAREEFDLKQAVVLGDWGRLSSREQLEAIGFTCVDIAGTAPETFDLQLLDLVTESLATNLDVYLLVSGDSDYLPVLRQIRSANRHCILWSSVPLSASAQALCTDWQLITPTQTEAVIWPRETVLGAIVFLADMLQQQGDSIAIDLLFSKAAELPIFGDYLHTWLNMALHQQILLLKQDVDGLTVTLNRKHAFTKKSLQIRERIIALSYALLGEKNWVAFSVLEQTLKTAQFLTGKQRVRQAWIEMLIALGMLNRVERPQPRGNYITTTITPDPDHPLVLTAAAYAERSAYRLAVVVDDFLAHGYRWMAVSALLRRLTQLTTRAEARAALAYAEKEGIVQIGQITSRRNSARAVTALTLNHQHPLVSEACQLRDQIIFSLYAHMGIGQQVTLGLGEDALLQKIAVEFKMSLPTAIEWFNIFVADKIIEPGSAVQHVQPFVLMDNHPVVERVIPTA